MDTAPLNELRDNIARTWKLLKLDETRRRIVDMQARMEQPNFWNDQETARTISQQLNELQKELATWEAIKREVDETIELAPLAETDAQMKQELEAKTQELSKRFEALEFTMMLSGEYDTSDAIVSFHAGAGGTDSQDWAEMLLRMVSRFCEKKGWKTEVLEISSGQEAGIKSATVHVRGRYAYGYLQSENGVHRLVRISPFDAEKMRHTSFALIEVIPDLGDVAEVSIDEKELRIDVFRAGGHGGQSVNTTDSAVRVVHIPTGITVSCQNEKSQHQNKAAALKILKAKLHKKYMDEKDAEKKRLRGEYASAEWGNQIRSYVLHPYQMVKDHRTEFEVSDPERVLGGDLQPFMEAYLRWQQSLT